MPDTATIAINESSSIFHEISESVSRIQIREEVPRTALVTKSGEGHFTIRELSTRPARSGESKAAIEK